MQESFGSFVNENVGLLKEYVEVRIELIKLRAVRMASHTLSILVTAFIIIMLSLFILLFLGLTFSAWITALTGSQVAGYVSTAGLYLILLLLVVALRRPLLQDPLIRIFINENLKDHEEESQNDDI
jgi:hypothetical protein